MHKLKENQLRLLRHLAQYMTLDYPNCLHVLDTDKTGDRTELSYSFRPLTKNGYVSKHKDGTVNILAKGRALFPNIEPLLTLGGNSGTRRRTNEISRMAMLMHENGYPSVAHPDDSEEYCFIPSTCWRKIRPGILSTTRFLGILMIGEHRLAVYDIGDGKIEWQLRAERSLFYNRSDNGDTHATGMLFVCEEDKRIDVAKNIIRHTMWNRRHLITDNHFVKDREKPVRYSRAPIRLTTHYEHVYLTTPGLLARDTDVIEREKAIIRQYRGEGHPCRDTGEGDYEVASNEDNLRRRFFINLATDLLKYVYFFAAVKGFQSLIEGSLHRKEFYSLKYAITMPRRDLEILHMYPDVLDKEVMELYEYRH